MSATPYSLRSRLNGQSPSLRTPAGSPGIKTNARSPRKVPSHQSGVALQLQQVIGTTTNSPTGLACCPLTNSYAYCAGAIAVVATILQDGTTTKRYFKSRPNAASLNPSSSYYDTASPSVTPSRRRTSIFASRKTQDADIGRDWQDDGTSQTWTARERIKTVTCVALSQNGKWLAVGESGYNPRVILYCTIEEGLLDTPLSVVSDHTFGLKSVAFSPDSRFLATLGTLNDGFIFVWAINPKSGSLTLHSTNKCTTNINDMIWCGHSLVTIGTRHVKLWSITNAPKSSPSKRFKLRQASEEVASPGPTTLSGRNALLGSLVDCTFTSAVAVDNSTLIVASDEGHLCGVKVSDSSPELSLLKTYDYGLTSISWQASTQQLVLGGRQGISYESFQALATVLRSKTTVDSGRPKSPRKPLRSSSIRRSLGLLQSDSPGVSALACLTQHTVALDSDSNLHLNIVTDGGSHEQLSFACHNDMIQGVQKLGEKCAMGTFFTWSRRGEIRFWDTGGSLLDSKLLPLDQDAIGGDGDENELRVVRHLPSTSGFICGDRFGIVKVVEGSDFKCAWTGRAHGAELTDMSVHDATSLVVTCGRDRMVQLFTADRDGLNLAQTMDDHIGAVNEVKFTKDADKILSCSADRTIVVRERVSRRDEGQGANAYLSARIITLRSTPLSMTLFESSTSLALFASTSDRHVVKVDPLTGTIVETHKVTDPENDDTVALSSICISARSTGVDEACNLLAAYSSTDKSIRVYDADKCLLLARESGHTEGISDICLIETRAPESDRMQRTLVSTGLDGTVMMWNIALSSAAVFTPTNELSQLQAAKAFDLAGTPSKPSSVSLPPLRKVLSKMDVVEFTRSPGTTSPASPRSLSPPRLMRKRSQLALSTTIDEKEEDNIVAAKEAPKREPTASNGRQSEMSPSPPSSVSSKLRRQCSKPELSIEQRAATARRSPSPPAPYAGSPLTTPLRANNSRLRRPPSVPTDLRGQALNQGRRQSMSQTSDFGSMGMATEQACRMLRTYRKKLMASKEELILDELQEELELMSKLVRQRKDKTASGQTPVVRRIKAKAATENDVDELAVLLDRTNMADRSPRQGVEVQC
jgi:WD40 repeat protein